MSRQTKKPSPLQKAAILIASLDRDSADRLLDQMTASEAQQVRDQVLQLDEIDPQLQQQILGEFFGQEQTVEQRHVENNAHDAVDLSMAGLQAEQLQTYAPTWQANSSQSMQQPLQFLSELPAAPVAKALTQESPQTIAVILAHVSPRHAAAILEQFNPALQADIARRIIDLDETDPLVIQDLAQTLAATLDQELRRERRRSSGMNRLAGILAASPEQSEQRILTNLHQFDVAVSTSQSVGNHTHEQPATIPFPGTSVSDLASDFSSLMQLTDAALLSVLQATDSDTVVLALAGAEPELIARVTRRLPASQAKLLQRALRELGPTRLRDVEAAQQQLLMQAQTLRLLPHSGRQLQAA